MLTLGALAVFVVTLGVAWLVLKIVTLFQEVWKWHSVLDNALPHEAIHPVWGNLHQIKSFKEFSDRLLNKFINAGSKAYVYWLGYFSPVVNVGHPETVKAILRTSEPKSRGAGGYDFLIPWLGEGLLISNGRKWERTRRLLTPAFHFDILKHYVKIYNKTVQGLFENIEKQSKGGNSVEVFGPASLTTLDTMLQCALSYAGDIQEKGTSHPYVKSVNRLQVLFFKRFVNMFHHMDFLYNLSADGREYKKLCNYVHDFSEKIIDSRKRSLENNPDQLKKRHLDFLDILLTARDETGQGLTDKEIRDEVDTFMFAGHDTTSAAISWSLYCMALYPEEQQSVLEEVQQVIGEKEEVEWEDLAKFNYLTMFIRESLRLYPPVPLIGRTLDQPLVVDGVELPKGVSIDINLQQTHRNPNVWPEPLKFDPLRFDPDTSAGRDPYCFVPFSAGPRNCIGQAFALNEIKVVLALVIRRFEVSLDKDRPPKVVFELTNRTEDGLYLNFQPRSVFRRVKNLVVENKTVR